MNIKFRWSACFFFLLLSLAIRADAQQPTYKVRIDVKFKDDALGATVESYLSRELRSLNDIEIVGEKDAAFTIEVLGLHHRSVGGNELGYTISAVITERSNCGLKDSKGREFFTYECDDLKDHLLRTGNRESLRHLCEAIITSFDTRTIEPIRRLRRNAAKQVN